MAAEQRKETGCDACCLFCIGWERTCFCPTGMADACGHISAGYNGFLCTKSKWFTTICSGHDAFASVSGGREDVICVGYDCSESIVKPLWVTGDKPFYKNVSKGCCFSERLSCFLDKDQPGRCSCLPCCYVTPSFGCCPSVPAVPESSYGGFAPDTHKVKSGVEYICCASPLPVCSVFTLFIPETFKDGLGHTDDCTFLCCECSDKLCMLPGVEDEDIFINFQRTCFCVAPKTCCKVDCRDGFTYTKCAFPCDDQVPVALACCGITCCGSSEKFQPVYISTKCKDIDSPDQELMKR